MSFFSFGKKEKHAKGQAAATAGEGGAKNVPVKPAPGVFSIRWTSKGVLLKVTPPVGTGRPIIPEAVLKALDARDIHEFDIDTVKQVVQGAADAFVLIGPPAPASAPEAKCTALISSDKHHAFLTLLAPESGQRDVEVDAMKQKLQAAGAVFGVDEQALENLLHHPAYGKPVTVASWKESVEGKDGDINLQFDVSKEREVNLVEVNGRVDYRELSIVNSVPAGTVLAVKTPATKGEPGVLVTGESAPVKPGKEVSFSVGKNVKLSEDELQAIAETSGQPAMRGRKIEIDAECIVQDVTLETGNIDFEGHVLIRGNIEDDFTVKSSDTVEVMGSIGASRVVATGDIRVKGGIMGKGHSFIQAGGSVYSKFIDKADIEAGGGVYADDGITHSRIDAGDEVVCVNKRGAIFGGRIRAGLRVEANLLGNVAAPETVIQVGIDPEKRQRLKELDEERRINMRETESVQANLETLKKTKAAKGTLPHEKQKQLDALFLKDKELGRQRVRFQAEEDSLNEHPYDPSTPAQVIVRDRAFPHVYLQIGQPQKELQTEQMRKVFALKDGEVCELPIDQASKSVREE